MPLGLSYQTSATYHTKRQRHSTSVFNHSRRPSKSRRSHSFIHYVYCAHQGEIFPRVMTFSDVDISPRLPLPYSKNLRFLCSEDTQISFGFTKRFPTIILALSSLRFQKRTRLVDSTINLCGSAVWPLRNAYKKLQTILCSERILI